MSNVRRATRTDKASVSRIGGARVFHDRRADESAEDFQLRRRVHNAQAVLTALSSELARLANDRGAERAELEELLSAIETAAQRWADGDVDEVKYRRGETLRVVLEAIAATVSRDAKLSRAPKSDEWLASITAHAAVAQEPSLAAISDAAWLQAADEVRDGLAWSGIAFRLLRGAGLTGASDVKAFRRTQTKRTRRSKSTG